MPGAARINFDREQMPATRRQPGCRNKPEDSLLFLPALPTGRAVEQASTNADFQMNPTKALPAEMSQWFKDRFYASRALQYPYRSWLDMQSKAALARRLPFEAASRMLHMWR